MKNRIRVLHLSTHDEECGIAKYQEQFIETMKTMSNIENEFFEYSPNQTRFMNKKQYASVLEQFTETIKKFDILHIQHEMSFYRHQELARIIDISKSLNKKILVTIHTSLDIKYKKPTLLGYSPHSLAAYLRSFREYKQIERVHINPLKKVDLILVHNEVSKQALESIGFKNKIQKILLPVPISKKNTKNKTPIRQMYDYQPQDRLICTVGFISRTKGIDQAIKALRYLPKEYKLIVIGGIHPSGQDRLYLDELTDYIADHKLNDRVYITGYIENDDELNSMIQECDLCVFPYDSWYYSYVSSAALNNAFANHKAALAYKTSTFVEINKDEEVIKFCKSANYYELAKEIQKIDIDKYSKLSKNYAIRHSYEAEVGIICDAYETLLNR